MANTLKFGNGEWYGKKDTILAYNDENNNYKPLPFSFDRASSATVINKNGLIETVGGGEPRIDYKDDSKGALLLEPSRSNILPYSEDFINAAWAKQNVTINSNQIIAPDGTLTADKIIDNSTNSAHRITDGNTTSSSGSFTYSIFLKKGTLTTAQIQVFNSGTASSANVDLVNGTITSDGAGVDHKIENYGNDWFKCSISGTLSNTATTVYLYLKQKPSYIGNEDYLYAWGAQLEQGSYATSYIPTQGSTVTRVAESCTNGGNEQVINSTEGVLYYESTYTDGSDYNSISISNTSGTEKCRIWYDNTNLVFATYVGGVNQTFIGYPISKGITYKIGIRYKLNDFALFVDGVKATNIIVSLGGVSPANSYNHLSFTSGDIYSPFYGNIKDLRVYNTALTDQELINLTTI